MKKILTWILASSVLLATSFWSAMYQPTAVDTQIVSTFSAKITTMYQANPMKIKNIGTKLSAIVQMFGEDTMEYYVLDALYRHIITLTTQETVTVVVPTLPSTAWGGEVVVTTTTTNSTTNSNTTTDSNTNSNDSMSSSSTSTSSSTTTMPDTTTNTTTTNTSSWTVPVSSTATPQWQALSNAVNNGYIKGNPSAKFTLIEFWDFQCPFCQRFNLDNVVEDTLSHFEGQVNTIFAHLPLASHPLARDAALAAECVWAQVGALWFHRYKHELFFLWFTDISKATEALQYVWVDVDRNAFDTCVANNTYASKVQDDFNLAISVWASWTPTSVFLNRETGQYKVIPGVPTAQSLIEIISELEPSL